MSLVSSSSLSGKFLHSTIMKLDKTISLIILISILLGVFLALSFRALKYSEYISPTISEISPKELYAVLKSDNKQAIFVDVRSEYEYAQAHAEGSVNLPIHYMYDDTHGLKNEKGIDLPKNTDQKIYLICTGGRLAGVAYSYLEHYGYRNIQRVEGGITNWNNQGLPVVTKSLFNLPSDIKINTPPPLDKPYESRNP